MNISNEFVPLRVLSMPIADDADWVGEQALSEGVDPIVVTNVARIFVKAIAGGAKGSCTLEVINVDTLALIASTTRTYGSNIAFDLESVDNIAIRVTGASGAPSTLTILGRAA